MKSKRFSNFGLCLIITILILSLVAGSAQAQIGQGGGTVTIKTDIEMMSGIPVHGGGHITWIVTGAAAGEFRQALIEQYDIPTNTQPANGQLDETEIEQYKIHLEQYLDDESLDHEYMGARISNTQKLNKKVKDYTEGLLGASNATTGKVVIKFYFEAYMEDAGDDEFELSDTTIATAIFQPLNETYHGGFEIEHTEYMVNIASYADMKITKGSFFLIRTPFGEIYHYSVKFDSQADNPREMITYQPFNWLEAPLVLFIVMIVFGYFVVTMPGRFRRYDVMKVIKLHTFAKVLLLILILLYFFAAFGGVFIGGIYLILISVVFLFVSLVVSKTVYENAKRITTMPDKPDSDTLSDELEDEVEEDMGRDVQCTTCGEIFSVGEDRFRLESTPCPACGSIGAVEFSRTEQPPPPPPEDLDSIDDSGTEEPLPPPSPEDPESIEDPRVEEPPPPPPSED
jgi:hypothetical protein